MTSEDEHRIAAMETRLAELEQESQEIKARAMANFALQRCLVAVLPTGELAALERTFSKLAEELMVKFMYGSFSEATNQAAAASYEDWLGAIRKELQARHAASNPKP